MYKEGASPLDAMFSEEGEEIVPIVTAFYLNNHVSITVQTHSGDFEGKRIVGVEVEPKSIQHLTPGQWNDDNPPKCVCDSSPRRGQRQGGAPDHTRTNAQR